MEVGEFAFPIDPVENLIRGMGQGAYRGRRGEGGYSQSPFPRLIHFYFLFDFFARLLPINWMSWTTTIRTRMVATMTSAWKRW